MKSIRNEFIGIAISFGIGLLVIFFGYLAIFNFGLFMIFLLGYLLKIQRNRILVGMTFVLFYNLGFYVMYKYPIEVFLLSHAFTFPVILISEGLRRVSLKRS